MAPTALDDPKQRKAYVVTGPTSGIGRCTALALAKHGTVVPVGRAPKKLAEVQQLIEAEGGRAVSVVCDLAAAAQMLALNLPIAGLLNNAGIMQMHATKQCTLWRRWRSRARPRGCASTRSSPGSTRPRAWVSGTSGSSCACW